MLPFGVTIPATVPQRSEIPEGLMNYSVLDAQCEAEKTNVHLHNWPRTCKIMGDHLNPGSFSEYMRHLVIMLKDENY